MDLNLDLFKIDKNDAPARGKVLISEPFLKDQFFDRSVVLLTEHHEKGSVGFVLNKPTKLIIDEVMDGFPSIRSVLSIGGPVSPNTLHYLHTLGEAIPESIEVLPGLFWGGDFEQVKFLIESKVISPDQIRFFIGYSGWAEGQLDNELKENSWLVCDVEKDLIMKNISENIWKDLLNKLGAKYRLWAEFPNDPTLN